MECDRMVCRPLFEVIPQQHHRLPLRIGQESLTTGNQRIDLFGIFQLAEQFGTYFLEPLQSVLRIRKPIGRRSRKSRERDALPAGNGILQVRNHLHLLQPVNRKL